MPGVFDRLNKEIESKQKDGGITALDLADLSHPSQDHEDHAAGITDDLPKALRSHGCNARRAAPRT